YVQLHADRYMTYANLFDFLSSFVFFSTTSPTAIYTLSLHDALPIFDKLLFKFARIPLRNCLSYQSTKLRAAGHTLPASATLCSGDRKSTRLNSSHVAISYAVFCLKKKKSAIVIADTNRPDVLDSALL